MIWLALYIAVSIALAFWLRHHLGWAQRLNDCNWQAWVLADIVAAFLIFWPIYLVGLVDDRPGNGLTISALRAQRSHGQALGRDRIGGDRSVVSSPDKPARPLRQGLHPLV